MPDGAKDKQPPKENANPQRQRRREAAARRADDLRQAAEVRQKRDHRRLKLYAKALTKRVKNQKAKDAAAEEERKHQEEEAKAAAVQKRREAEKSGTKKLSREERKQQKDAKRVEKKDASKDEEVAAQKQWKVHPGVGNYVDPNATKTSHHRRRGITRRALLREGSKTRSRKSDLVTYECTIHLAKRLHGKKFSKRAPMAVKKIREFASKLMKTKDNRIDGELNTFLWHRGVKGVPGRVRVRIQRKVGDNPKGKKKRFYTIISHVPVPDYSGLLNMVITQ